MHIPSKKYYIILLGFSSMCDYTAIFFAFFFLLQLRGLYNDKE